MNDLNKKKKFISRVLCSKKALKGHLALNKAALQNDEVIECRNLLLKRAPNKSRAMVEIESRVIEQDSGSNERSFHSLMMLFLDI